MGKIPCCTKFVPATNIAGNTKKLLLFADNALITENETYAVSEATILAVKTKRRAGLYFEAGGYKISCGAYRFDKTSTFWVKLETEPSTLLVTNNVMANV